MTKNRTLMRAAAGRQRLHIPIVDGRHAHDRACDLLGGAQSRGGLISITRPLRTCSCNAGPEGPHHEFHDAERNLGRLTDHDIPEFDQTFSSRLVASYTKLYSAIDRI